MQTVAMKPHLLRELDLQIMSDYPDIESQISAATTAIESGKADSVWCLDRGNECIVMRDPEGGIAVHITLAGGERFPHGIESAIRAGVDPECLVSVGQRMPLIKGVRYRPDHLRLASWQRTVRCEDGVRDEDSRGYRMTDYFDAEGVYLGPDRDGIEPVVVRHHPDL